MLQAVAPSSYSLRTSLLKTESDMADIASRDDLSHGSDDEDDGKGGRSKSRRELPAGAVATLKAWLLSPEHFTHPYPTPQDQVMLMQKTGIDKKQLKNWFTNARRRIWKPMLKKQLEQGKLTATGVVPGVMPGLMVQQMPGGMPGQPPENSGMNVHYHRAVQQQQMGHQPQDQQQVQLDAYGTPMYMQPGAHPPVASSQQQQYYEQSSPLPGPMTLSGSIGSLAPMTHTASGHQLSKTDSHAVLMELFARDQDLVRQATESAGKKAAGGISGQQSQQASSQHPMRIPSQGRLTSVPTLNSWPHFSSVSSLNNLGTMPGVKSITSLSGVDLASQGPVNRVGNLAQVKSVESMGKNDSYAFLEVFFGDRSSTNFSSGSKDNRGAKRERDEDNDVGLSLEDEGPAGISIKQETSGGSDSGCNSDLNPRFMTPGSKESSDSTGTLKRAYDDALAARGLISVSRSCENLTDLALPAKMQRTLSQEYLRQQSSQQQYGQYQYSSAPAPSDQSSSNQQDQNASQQYPGQQMQQQYQSGDQKGMGFMSDPSVTNASVEVPSATKCALCHQTNVDTQLRPCGHMFHERCLKPSLQAPMGPPKCPVDHIPMQSALLAVPTDEKTQPRPMASPMQPQPPSWSSSVGVSAPELSHQA